MTYFADYKVVDGMTFVRVTTPKGTVVSYGKTSTIALINLTNKYGFRHKERLRICLGKQTTDPIENDVAVRRNRNTEWWYKHKERKAALGLPENAVLPDAKENAEYIYDVEDGVLKVYRVTLEKAYKIKQPQKTVAPVSGLGGGSFGRVLGDTGGGVLNKMPAEPGMVLFNSDRGDKDVA